MPRPSSDPLRFVQAIRRSGLTIYDAVEIGHPGLWIPAAELQILLDRRLRKLSLAGLPLRTRSKIVKQQVCKALGYPIPDSFRKTKPRFPAQVFDTYVQKSNNLQIWNEELGAARRYVLIRVSAEDVITRVKVVTGDVLARLDTTGTLTQKYQARCVHGDLATELISPVDTKLLRRFVSSSFAISLAAIPSERPAAGELLPIAAIYDRLKSLVGMTFSHKGHDQERNRGAALHRLASAALGYQRYRDNGQFPDIQHQLLEVKLQTAPTIDLGLACPNSTEPLDIPQIKRSQIRHCDVRYGIFCGSTDGRQVVLTHFLLTTGEQFFNRFPQCQGKILNKKLQIPLPAGFFDA